MTKNTLEYEEKELLRNGCTIRELYTLRAKWGKTEDLEQLDYKCPERPKREKITTFKLKP